MDEETITCSVCFELFTDPYIYQCTHTFCRDCITPLGKSIQCPICRTNIDTSNGILNRAIRNAVDQVKKEDAKNIMVVHHSQITWRDTNGCFNAFHDNWAVQLDHLRFVRGASLQTYIAETNDSKFLCQTIRGTSKLPFQLLDLKIPIERKIHLQLFDHQMLVFHQ